MKKLRKKAIAIAIAAVMVMTVLVGAAVGTDGILIPVSQADTVTIVEGTVYPGHVEPDYLTYSVDLLMSTGAMWTSAAGEQYTFTSDGTYLKIECYDVPGPGLGVGGNIGGVRLSGVPGYPEGVWATVIVSYSLGSRGEESFLSRILGSDLSYPYTRLGDYYTNITVGFGELSYAVSSNISGAEKNTFDLSESVYCYAGNLPANDNVVHIYVVPNRDDWAVGDTIGSDVSSNGVNTVSTDSSGNIDVTEIWPSPLDAGQYDIIVDWDQDGELDEGEPVDAMTTTGFEATNTPPIADANGSYVGYEGTKIIFNGSGSYDENDYIVSWLWDLDGDGIYETNATATNGIVNYTWDDDYSGNVSLKVTDSFGATDIDDTTVIVLNVLPTVNAGPDQEAIAEDTVSFNGSFTDPGDDTHTIEWDFGDGESAIGTLTPTHIYYDKGVYNVTLTVTDDDEGVGTDTAIVTVNPITANVIIKPETLNLKSKGVFTAFIELPEEFNVAGIDIDSMVCEGAKAVKGMVDGNVFIAKFDREDLRDDLPTGDAVELTVTGELKEGTPFEGSDTIRVIDKGKGK